MAAAPLPLPPAGGYINAPPKALDQSATTSAQGACVAFFFLFPDISQNLISYFIFYRLPTLMFRSLRSPRIKFCFFPKFFILFYLFFLSFFLLFRFLWSVRSCSPKVSGLIHILVSESPYLFHKPRGGGCITVIFKHVQWLSISVQMRRGVKIASTPLRVLVLKAALY